MLYILADQLNRRDAASAGHLNPFPTTGTLCFSLSTAVGAGFPGPQISYTYQPFIKIYQVSITDIR